MLRRLFLTNVLRSIRALQSVSPARSVWFWKAARLEQATPHPTNFNVIQFYCQSPCFPNKAVFEEVCDETLDSLTDFFEELVEDTDHLAGADVNYSDGVLTVQFGEPFGTYVINRQTPNEQIWLSSPTSGPKRYDYVNGAWMYRHDGVGLHELLSEEISKIVRKPTDFKRCSHSSRDKK